jgi:cytochrome c-type biogenesis protein CcmH
MRAGLSRAWCLMRLFAAVLVLVAGSVLLLAAVPALAVEPAERLANPALEARARTISGELRCLVCQNESIDESGADLAHDIRILVRQRLTAGDTDAAAIQAIVSRYGAFVLLKPPVEPATYVLWYGPPALVLFGLAGTLVWLRRRRVVAADTAPLSPEETRRLDGLMRENDV